MRAADPGVAQDRPLEEEGGVSVLRRWAWPNSDSDLLAFAGQMRGQLTATLMASEIDLERHAALVGLPGSKVGWLLFNGYPTGVEVSDAIVHGGLYPATTDVRGTWSVAQPSNASCAQLLSERSRRWPQPSGDAIA
uniref:hypothetical protein n=1 Tax=Cupriavidus necator TaxID=106590 RepID=UPI003F493144